MKKILPFAALLLLAACGSNHDNYQAALNGYRVGMPKDYTAFKQCHGYGCRVIDNIALTKGDWKMISKAFNPKPKNAEDERKRIAKAIGIMETRVGKLNGTSADKVGTFKYLGTEQLDCVDESINTTTYLHLLAQGGLLKHNQVYAPETRVPALVVIGGWPHRTAVIADIKTGERYAVDSWFYDNGHDAVIVPLKDWKSGWKPKDFKGG